MEVEVVAVDVGLLCSEHELEVLVFLVEQCDVGVALTVGEVLYHGFLNGGAFGADGELYLAVLEYYGRVVALQGFMEEGCCVCLYCGFGLCGLFCGCNLLRLYGFLLCHGSYRILSGGGCTFLSRRLRPDAEPYQHCSDEYKANDVVFVHEFCLFFLLFVTEVSQVFRSALLLA